MTDSVLAMAFVYLLAAVICVPVAKRLGLGAVLGYLVAGVLIGPWVLGFVGHEHHSVGHFAEFGVVMMLFLVGLELRPALLWQMRKPIFGLGGAQVVGTAVVVGAAALALGVHWKPALAVGLIFACSSTAIVLSTLAERGLLKTQGGQASFAVLLFQDIAVIPILAVFPLLAMVPAVLSPDAAAAAGDSRPGWQTGLMLFGAVAGVIAIGRFIVRPVFQFLAAVKVRESFTAAALLIVVGIALLMQQVGLSPALGTFLAGVVLADSEYRHELETDIEPFKGLLLGLFFISIGAQIDFGLIASEPAMIGGMVLATMTGKLVVLWSLGRVFGLDRPSRWLLAFSLAQIGEFAFVLLQFGMTERVFTAEFTAPLVAAVALSMGITPLLFVVLERVVLPRLADPGREARPHDEIATDAETPVVIAGYGRFGQMVGRILRANRIPLTILDLDPEMVELVGKIGVKVYYGDASRVDLLHAAGCEHAKLFVLAVDDKEEATKIVENVRHHFPHLTILARARDRQHYWELRKLGCAQVFRETFGSAYEAGIAALIKVGFRSYTAHRLAKRWRDHEEQTLEELGKHWGTKDYFARARMAMEEAERLMRHEDPTVYVERDAAWDNESLRADRKVDAAAIDAERS
ncbi:MAG: cation:proton antiporter [Deltaproteobacteria bacterium]|nr:cation:proton antiporter [Deltaproteobacteria bacterium]MDQ3301460.1 monovalent cation:proton antiporter-2 (CPA2) family protein [Myxococcota bacterium]